MSAKPITSGTRTCVDYHPNCIPPQVSAVKANVVTVMTMACPLRCDVRCVLEVYGFTHIRSMRASFCNTLPSGVRTRKKTATSTKAMPDSGRLRSRQIVRCHPSGKGRSEEPYRIAIAMWHPPQTLTQLEAPRPQKIPKRG